MKGIIIGVLLICLVLPLVSADLIMPTVTKVYFEKNIVPYNESIEFTVKGYGYSYPVGPFIEKEAGTYTPEVVFSFSASYENYGDKIYENYYMNYRLIDYFELEGKMADGKTFIIRNISQIPTNCSYNEYITRDDKYYRRTNNYTLCISELQNYVPTYGPAEQEKTGATRKDDNGNIWTKQADGTWKILNNIPAGYEGTSWGDVLIDSQKGGIDYAIRGGARDKCDSYLQEIPESELEKDDMGYVVERGCEIRLSLDNANWNYTPEAVKKGFWQYISCFFKGIFGKVC